MTGYAGHSADDPAATEMVVGDTEVKFDGRQAPTDVVHPDV